MEAAARCSARCRESLLYPILARYLRVGDDTDTLDHVFRRIYTQSAPENTLVLPTHPLLANGKLLVMPLYLLLTRRVVWRRGDSVDLTLETIDRPYFDRWFATLYARVTGTKRIAPRSAEGFADTETTGPVEGFVYWRDLLWLFVLCPVSLLPLYRLSKTIGVDLAAAYVSTLAIYAKYSGYFRRHPCRIFVTFSDEFNHPCRHIAFRQNSGRELMVIQNGERIYNPQFACGVVDRYFVFGEAYAEVLRRLDVRAKEFLPVGALCLNEHFDLVRRFRAGANGADRDLDIVFIDQSFYPFNGLTRHSSASVERILRNMAEFRRRNPDRRVAYQLRSYGADSNQKRNVIERVRQIFDDDIEILDNKGRGETYWNALRANLLVTFESTFGFEAMRMGRKVLFVNYSGDSSESLCPDPRFQLEDSTADYDLFERRVREVSGLDLDGIPEVALERHCAFDGRVQERVAEAIERVAS